MLELGAGWFPEQAGGLERVYHALMQHFLAVGVEADGWVVGAEQLADRHGLSVRPFDRPDAPLLHRWYQLRRAVREALGRRSYSIVAAHFALYAAPVLDLVDRYPFVVHFHGPWAWESRREDGSSLASVKAVLERSVYRRADRCIVLSHAFKTVLCHRYGVAEQRVHVVPGGVEWQRFDTGLSRRTARQRLGWPTDRPLVLAVRRLTRRMGLENLVEAMQELKRAVPEVLLLIAGKGPLAAELETRIQERDLAHNVRLLGFVAEEELPLAYRAADLSVVPSQALEGFGLITLESLAAGTPVLVTPVGGLPEAVRPLEPELVLGGTGPDALAQGLAEALTGERRLPTAEACQQHVRAHHDWGGVAAQVKSIYQEAMAQKERQRK